MRNWTSNELFIGGQRIHWLLGRIHVLNFNNLCYRFSHMETALLPEIPEGGYVNLDYTYWLAESSSFAEVLL